MLDESAKRGNPDNESGCGPCSAALERQSVTSGEVLAGPKKDGALEVTKRDGRNA